MDKTFQIVEGGFYRLFSKDFVEKIGWTSTKDGTKTAVLEIG